MLEVVTCPIYLKWPEIYNDMVLKGLPFIQGQTRGIFAMMMLESSQRW
jgi:hypothetical protein